MLALIGYILINFNVTPHSKLKNTHCLLNHFFNHYLTNYGSHCRLKHKYWHIWLLEKLAGLLFVAFSVTLTVLQYHGTST